MQGKRFMGASLGIVWYLLLAPAILFGQYGSGAILGTVTDPTGAVIPGATVIARNAATNEVRTFTTDAEGFYHFSAAPSGTYTISVTAPSFRTAALPNVVVTVNTPPGFSQNTNYQWTNYNAGYVKLEQRVWHDLSYTVAYTFSKLMDSGAAGMNMYNRRPEREPALDNVPHNFILSYVWQLPVGKGKQVNIQNKLLDGVAGGWELSGITSFISGMNFTIVVTGDPANVLTGTERANSTGVKPQRLNPRTSSLLGFNTAAYATPPKGVFGNLGNNTQQGFGINDWDVSFSKNFVMPKLGEASRLHIRAEFFNFFNHTQFNNPAATVNVSTFGLVNSTHDPRILQLAAKLYW